MKGLVFCIPLMTGEGIRQGACVKKTYKYPKDIYARSLGAFWKGIKKLWKQVMEA